MPTLKRCVELYILAKDGNRPHLMADAFIAESELEMTVRTNDISFPSATQGLGAITKIMISDFAQRYENVYTFCLGEPDPEDTDFSCDWLVCMTEKKSGAARLGYGQYRWEKRAALLTKLTITIDEMLVLEKETAAPLLEWAKKLPYPWCSFDAMKSRAPDVSDLTRILEALR
ncbi:MULTISPECIES: hypothetical protein [Paraburkholderia]|uniref:Uncharacterized protein n=1 Tax=Paraburkholderia dipogonis TaxID=1211383 RepID=A0A4Y8MH20_9BURK|nr:MULTISPECIES: hypothetical protein [Paraburkholderia]RKR31322.1 hypothetical protein B0G82_7464 [Paraburkholderia sp. BL17N1]TFE36708.1 hypothetical protein E2553_44410 [Paraburkholderia dipogonis]